MTPQINILLHTDQSNDAVGLVELTVPPEWDGPPLHHHDFDEAFYMLEGGLTFRLGDELRTVRPDS
jgi:mannose-6-phosphate isomerase-like protein (cupin superfamily)